ncbi:hypothetical protein [Halorussus sp. MSC15.2]|uniref:hypothetical protein n=1 Tax=Halorussus sp. MSC15.2 TaxID=2283638 RepID=UPI0013D60263|nr:hypothetical protein [Halorussus sp. MSC15.2]NEU56112.1 hypothetical protein [Halorussus sp. MSC15.2]
MTEDDPRNVRSLAVAVGDVVTAYEARRRSERRPVLRVTPPFSGRMRARLHDPGPAAQAATEDDDRDTETGALHVPPARFLAEEGVPQYPTPDSTEDALRSDPDTEFSVERHRERHVEAVEAWRTAVGEAIVSSLNLRLGEGTHSVEVKTLGDSSV